MYTDSFFPYSWHIDEAETDITSIRIYGLNNNNDNVCLRIDNFTPYVYIELPTNILWNSSKAQLLGNKLDDILGSKRPLSKVLVHKKRLYGAYFNNQGERKKFPYLFCSFSSRNDIKTIGYRLQKPFNVNGLGMIKIKIHESDADPILQFTCCRQISTAGWIKFSGKKIDFDNQITLCDYEYTVLWKNVSPEKRDNVPLPKVMGFDIEVNSSNPSAFPNALKPADKIFQISCVMSRSGSDPSLDEKYLLSLGEPDQQITGEDVIIYMFQTESDLLEGFTELIRTENPNIIVGYNILGFDIPFMIARAKLNLCTSNFDKQGFHKTAHAKEKIIKWSSSAYKNQEFEFLDAEGRVFVDLLPLVRRDYKFNNYRLGTIASYFIGETKDPLCHKGIFKCYRIGTKRNSQQQYSYKAKRAMAICGKYCVQDSVLVIRLWDKLKTWVGLTEMAKTCGVSIFVLYTQGQQIKVYSQLYKYCMLNDIVVEKDGYQVGENERYVGAKVFPPIPGRYKMVVPFDFASLYPTTIIAYNIDYHTWVPDDSNIPDYKCHVMEWEDHQGCQHDPKVIRKKKLNDYIATEEIRIKKLRETRNITSGKECKQGMMNEINRQLEELKPYKTERADLSKTIPKIVMCEHRRYKFLKEPKGVMPTVIQNLLDARKYTRKVDMKACKIEIKRLEEDTTIDNTLLINAQKSLLDILDKRQLAYKVSSNSMYGAMGVRRGYLPFMPGAMCTTYMGRVNIEIVASTIPTKYGGEFIYGDTDSNYIHFPHLKTAHETWDYALQVAEDVTKLFPAPIVLEFEEEIYSFFFILSKKRYMYRKCLRDGVVDQNIGKKGVLLARRDNSKFVKDLYGSTISKIADNIPSQDIIYDIIQELNIMCSGAKPHNDFVITKAVGNSGDLLPVPFVNEKGIMKAMVGDYNVPILSTDKNIREEQILKKGATSEEEYYLMCLPAQVQLSERMKRRGQRVDTGTRLEYIVSNPEDHTAKQYEKIESIDYLMKHSDVVKIDYLYYLKQLVNPMDQMLDVAFGKDEKYKLGVIMEQYRYRLKVHRLLMAQLRTLFSPSIVIKS
jgi:DNA polymerase elongation subunit (family B)